jgi:hypothetical protein
MADEQKEPSVQEMLKLFTEQQKQMEQYGRTLKAMAAKDEKKAKRGRPEGPVREICNWLLSFCETIKGDNGDVYVEVKNRTHSEWNGRYSFTGVLPNEKRLDDVLVIMRTKQFGEQPTPEQISKGIEMYLQRTRPGARQLQVARRVGHVVENKELVKYVDRGASLTSKRFIRIDASGIELVSSSGELLFINEYNTRELPEPEVLSNFATIEAENVLGISADELRVIFMYQLQLLLLDSNYINVFFCGPTRSGKSTRAAYTQHVLQPHRNFQSSEAMPEKYEDILLRGMNTLSICYDNISNINKDQSDTFCRMSTGAEFHKRMLYTDKGMVNLETKNPVIFTSVYDAIQRNDLLSRTLIVRVYPRSDGVGDDPQKLESDFRSLHAYWLGALCNAASGALAHIHEVRSSGLGDMAAFERWMIAAGISLTQNEVVGWSESEVGRIIRAYAPGKHKLPPVLQLVEDLLERYTNGTFEYEETASQLLIDLRKVAELNDASVDLPGDAERLSRLLNSSKHALIEHDIWVKTGAHTRYGNRVALKLLMSSEDKALRNFASMAERRSAAQ